MFLHIINSWILIFFTICFATCFGIELWWVLAPNLVSCWHPFGKQIMFCSQSFVWWLLDCFLIDLWSKREPNLVPFSLNVSSLFLRGCFGTSRGSLWHPLGFIFVVCCTFPAPSWEPYTMFFHVFLKALICWWLFDLFPQHNVEGILSSWPWPWLSSLLDFLFLDTLWKTAVVVFVLFSYWPFLKPPGLFFFS